MSRSIRISIALLSASLLTFQIVLLQAFSSVQWYHFAYMVISVALLGFGASGTVLTLGRRRFLRYHREAMVGAMVVSAATMPVSLILTQHPPARFDSYLLLTDPGQVGALILSYLFLAVPFFSGALAIGLAFVRYTKHMGALYFANLAGSGFGGIVGLALLFLASPPRLAAATGLMVALAAAFLLREGCSRRTRVGWALVLVMDTILLAAAPPLRPSEYKDIERTLLMPGVETLTTVSHPMGTLTVLRSRLFREAPGLSLTYRGEVPPHDLLFINGDLGRSLGTSEHARLRDFTTSALPYVAATADTVLVLGGVRPSAIGQALAHGAQHVRVVEPHSGIRGVLSRREVHSPVDDPRVEVYGGETRSLLAGHDDEYDLILMADVGAFGGASGLSALQEQYDLTVEALDLMWRRLTDRGFIAATAWVDYPTRNPLRLLGLLLEMLDRNGVDSVENHLFAVRSWGSVTFLVSRRPTSDSVEAMRTWARDLLFDPLVLPDTAPTDRNRYNVLQDSTLLQAVDSLLAGNRAELFRTYPFRVSPPSDERPYFSQFVKWGRLRELAENFGRDRIPFFELGTLTVALTLLQIVAVAVLLIVVPLVRAGWTGTGKSWTVIYFGCLGMGFMFVELVMIQRFTMYLGHPLLAVAFVFTVMLVSSGLGSLKSARIAPQFLSLGTATARIFVGLVAILIVLPVVVDSTIGFGLAWRIVVGTLLLAPVSFLMGYPFPMALRVLDETSAGQVPWAWAINGCASVAGAPAAVLTAAEIGATPVLLLASLFYSIAAIATRLTRRPGT